MKTLKFFNPISFLILLSVLFIAPLQSKNTLTQPSISAGTVSTIDGGTEVIAYIDGQQSNRVQFMNSGSTPGVNYSYVIVRASDETILLKENDDKHNFRSFPIETQRVYGIAHVGNLKGIKGKKITDPNLSADDFAVSNNFVTIIKVDADTSDVDGGILEGDPISVCPFPLDMAIPLKQLKLSGNKGTSQKFILADNNDTIVRIAKNKRSIPISALILKAGAYKLYHISYENTTNLTEGVNLNNLDGVFDLSNAIDVEISYNKPAVLSGVPTEVIVDGTNDAFSSIVLETKASDESAFFIINRADFERRFLAVYESLNALQNANLESVITTDGFYELYSVGYSGTLENFEIGSTISDVVVNGDCGTQLSFINIYRFDGFANPPKEVDGGTLNGDDIIVCNSVFGDEFEEIFLLGNRGENSKFIIVNEEERISLVVDDKSNLADPSVFQNRGEYLIYHISYNSISGLKTGRSLSKLKGEFDLSNAIKVTLPKNSAAKLEGVPTEVVLDGKPDMLRDIRIAEEPSNNSAFYIVNTNIRIIMATFNSIKELRELDIEQLVPRSGSYDIVSIGFSGSLQNFEPGNSESFANPDGCGSNSALVYRFNVTRDPDAGPVTPLDGGKLTGGPFTVCASDKIGKFDLTDTKGSFGRYILTNRKGTILAIKRFKKGIRNIDFSTIQGKNYFLYHMSYEYIKGLEAGANVRNLKGYFDFSNAIRITKTSDCNDPDKNALTEGGEPAEKFSLYPNPFINSINITNFNNEIRNISLINYAGQEISSLPVAENSSTIELNTADIPAGMYFIKLYLKTGTSITKKLIKK